MSFLEVENTKYIFFECYKIIENIQSVGSWYCLCHEYSECQEIKIFIKMKGDTTVYITFKTHLICGNLMK